MDGLDFMDELDIDFMIEQSDTQDLTSTQSFNIQTNDIEVIQNTSDKNENRSDKEIIVLKSTDLKFYPVLQQPESLSLFEFLMKRHPPSWHEFFESAVNEVRHACKMIDDMSLKSGKTILPLQDDILSAFWLTPFFMLKCVIIGQDPYPGLTKEGLPKAIGICFGSRRDFDIPDSLRNVYKELENTVEDWVNPGHPDIKSWGRQGVFLLNTALTVETGKANSHGGFWKPFTSKLLSYINEKCNDLVFMLWGKTAQRIASDIFTTKHLKLTAYHPSPRSANSSYSFIGCDHFNQANIHLVSKGIRPIDWRIK